MNVRQDRLYAIEARIFILEKEIDSSLSFKEVNAVLTQLEKLRNERAHILEEIFDNDDHS